MTAKAAAKKGAKGRKIEIDGATADLLQARAAALGISVAELMAAIVGDKSDGPPIAGNRDMLAGPPTAAGQSSAGGAEPPGERWREVKAWIDSWGKPSELPRPKLGK